MTYTIFWHEGEHKWCARNSRFNTPEDSPEGFGDNPIEALEDLVELMDKHCVFINHENQSNETEIVLIACWFKVDCDCRNKFNKRLVNGRCSPCRAGRY